MQIQTLHDDTPQLLQEMRDMPSLVVFSSFSCPACMLMEPELVRFAQQHDDIRVFLLHAERFARTAAAFHIRLFPTIVLLRDGKPVAMDIGAMRCEQLEEFVQNACDTADTQA